MDIGEYRVPCALLLGGENQSPANPVEIRLAPAGEAEPTGSFGKRSRMSSRQARKLREFALVRILEISKPPNQSYREIRGIAAPVAGNRDRRQDDAHRVVNSRHGLDDFRQ